MAKQTQPAREPETTPTPQAEPARTVATPDATDLSRLRISQDFGASIGGKKLITTIPMRKPNRFDWVQTHPQPDHRIPVYVLMDERDYYVVIGEIAGALRGDIVAMELIPTITRQGVLFLWPVRLPRPDGKLDGWNASAREAASRATQTWIRMASNMQLGAYEVFEAVGSIPEPTWPDMSFEQMIRVAVKDRVIETLDYPIIRRLRGEL